MHTVNSIVTMNYRAVIMAPQGGESEPTDSSTASTYVGAIIGLCTAREREREREMLPFASVKFL